MKLYLASPLGFCPEHDDYRTRIKAHLAAQGHQVVDPWELHEVEQQIKTALSSSDPVQQHHAIQQAAAYAGQANAEAIRGCDAVFAVLDGAEPDSGTVAEVGYAAGLGKVCYGLRADRRNMGELPGLPLNLQLLYFITASGGTLFRSLAAVQIS